MIELICKLILSLRWDSILIDGLNTYMRRDEQSAARLIMNIENQVSEFINAQEARTRGNDRYREYERLRIIAEGGIPFERPAFKIAPPTVGEPLDIDSLKEGVELNDKISFTSEGGFVIE